MPVRERNRSTVAAELAVLLDAGDNRAAAGLARRVLADAAATAADRAAADAALARVRPDRSVALAAAAGILLLTAAALLGLSR